jgi:integrase
MNSYQVRFWDIRRIGDTARGRYRVRWSAGGREHCKSFPTRALADAFLTTLKGAARDGLPFSDQTGLPRPALPVPERSWYDHARAYADMKWPDLAPKSRRSVAEALTTITLASTPACAGGPGPQVRRRALFGYAFNPASATRPVPPETARALARLAAASPPLAALDDPAVIRAVLAACARTLDDRPAAAATGRRKRAVFHNALGYAVELGLLPANPVDKIQRKPAPAAETVDRRVVASPAQAAALLAAVRAQGSRGEHLEAFFGCLYYAALRPSEAVALRDGDCVLPGLRLGPHRPVRLRATRRDRVDRHRHRPPGPRAQAPRAWPDPQHPHPAGPGRTAPQPPQAIRRRPRRPDLPHRPRRSGPGHRLRRSLAAGQSRGAHPSPAGIAFSAPAL